MPRRSIEAVSKTRGEILRRAADLATVEGLAGVTIGRLSEALFMSKSGLFAHFGSREELELAVVDTAAEAFEKEVIASARETAAGRERLLELTDSWIRYLEKGPFRGGCFFSSVALEVADRPGRVRDRVTELTRGWVEMLEAEVSASIDAREISADTDPAQLAFEIHAFLHEANRAFQLHGDAEAFRRAELAVRRAIESCP